MTANNDRCIHDVSRPRIPHESFHAGFPRAPPVCTIGASTPMYCCVVVAPRSPANPFHVRRRTALHSLPTRWKLFCERPTQCDCTLLGVPKAFQVAFRTEAPPSRVSKVRKALRVLFTGPDREKRLSVASALGVYKTPAIAGVLVLTGVLGTCFGPWVLDALGAKDPVVRAIIQGGTSSVFGIEAVSEARDVHRKRPANSTSGVSPSACDVSTVAMVLTGAAGTVLVNIPWVRSALLSIALGSTVVGAEMPLSP
ncbi:unnamed protein product [Ectocarpus sp. 4 AP-2014]